MKCLPGLLALLLATPAWAQDCVAAPGQAAAHVAVRGLRAPTGLLVVYLWADERSAFLEHGRSLVRVEAAVDSRTPPAICLQAPAPGRYAISVRHDVDGDRRRLDSSDGGGFSRNPRLSLAHLRPAMREVLIALGPGTTSVEIVLNYRFGLTVRPLPTP